VYGGHFRDALARVLDGFTPDFVLVSAGFDALKGDPLGGQLLEPEDFHSMTADVMGMAAGTCHGRVVALLEGGYDPPRVGQAALQTVRGLAGLQGVLAGSAPEGHGAS
jgi:acetoin utilization deacetylase AcuC-like enzyme